MNGFEFHQPASLAEATALLAEASGRASVLAGGTDLLVGLRSGATAPERVVDIKHIAGLAGITWKQDGSLEIGACTPVQRLADDEGIRRAFQALAEGAGAIGSVQIRARATLGGNLANASPCMDTAPPLLVLGARVRLEGPEGRREIPLSEFFLGVKQTALAAGEILTAVLVARPASGLRTGFAKIKRLAGHDLALVNAAAAFDPGARTLRAAIGSCGVTPIVLPLLTDIDESSDAGEVGRRLSALAVEHICPIDDVRASAEYRFDMAARLSERLAARLLGKVGS